MKKKNIFGIEIDYYDYDDNNNNNFDPDLINDEEEYDQTNKQFRSAKDQQVKNNFFLNKKLLQNLKFKKSQKNKILNGTTSTKNNNNNNNNTNNSNKNNSSIANFINSVIESKEKKNDLNKQ